MKRSAVWALLLALSGASWAGELSKISMNAFVELTEGCDPVECFETAEAKIRCRLEAAITPSEASQFGPVTVIDLDVPLFPVTIDFSQATDFSPEDTSISYTTTTMDGNVPILIKWTASWDGGKLQVDYSVTANHTETGPHDDFDPVLRSKLKQASQKLQTRDHSLPGLPFAVIAKNNDIEFIELPGLLICDASMSFREAITKKGVASGAETIELKGNKFVAGAIP